MSAWWEPVTAIGTCAAAGAAAWAALVSRNAAESATLMARFEAERRETERARPARQVLVDAQTRRYENHRGEFDCMDVQVQVINAGAEPVYRARLKIEADAWTWGPQLIGTLAGGRDYVLTLRLPKGHNPSVVEPKLRFADPFDVAWIASPSGHPVRTDEPVDEWIEQGKKFAAGELAPLERGLDHGSPHVELWERWFEVVRRVEEGDAE